MVFCCIQYENDMQHVSSKHQIMSIVKVHYSFAEFSVYSQLIPSRVSSVDEKEFWSKK